MADMRWTIFGALLLLMGCGEAEPDGQSDHAATTDVGVSLPEPSHHVTGRTLTVKLPYDGRLGLNWQLAQREEEIAPFRLPDVDAEPLAGGGGALGVTTMTFTADGPGKAKIEFVLVPPEARTVGSNGVTFNAAPHKRYSVEASVQ